MTKKNFFKYAYNMSLLSDFPRKHIGCIVTYKNKVISAGFNCSKTHPIQRKYNKIRFDCDNTPHKMHAEVNALAPIINNTDINWSKVQVYTYKEHKSGIRALARPCPACMELIKDLGIRFINYTTEDGYASEEIQYP